MQPGMDTSYSLSSSSGGGGGSGSGGIVSSSFTALSQPGRFVRFSLQQASVMRWGLYFTVRMIYREIGRQRDRQVNR